VSDSSVAWIRLRICGVAALCLWALPLACASDAPARDVTDKNTEPGPAIADPTGFENAPKEPQESAEVVELPGKKAPSSAAPAHIDIDLDTHVLDDARAEREADEREARLAAKMKPATVKPLESARVVAPDTSLQAPLAKVTEPGYASVLSGTLTADTELNPETLPHLIRGALLIPPKVTLKINAGALVHLRAANGPPKPVAAGSPDPSTSAVIWVYGALVFTGETGKPVELTNQEKDGANLLFYGGDKSDLRGGRLAGIDVAQNGGTCLWTNCEFSGSKFYLLASGGGLFTHCSFKKCGGIFAAYEEGPWALLARRCLFENCENGILFNHDPGADCLVVEKNNFVGTKGAHLRAMPRTAATSSKSGDELLIGSNWYGTTIEEEIDRRIVDKRTDPTLKAHVNTRPPADKPYATAGAGASTTQVLAALQEQQNAMVKMLQALTNKMKSGAIKKVAMDKSGAK
jgi:hypothetical protein